MYVGLFWMFLSANKWWWPRRYLLVTVSRTATPIKQRVKDHESRYSTPILPYIFHDNWIAFYRRHWRGIRTIIYSVAILGGRYVQCMEMVAHQASGTSQCCASPERNKHIVDCTAVASTCCSKTLAFIYTMFRKKVFARQNLAAKQFSRFQWGVDKVSAPF